MSKGSTPRPYSVSQKQFTDNWDAIFKKDKQEQKEKEKQNDSMGRRTEGTEHS